MQKTSNPQDGDENQVDDVKQHDQDILKHGVGNLNTQVNKLSANQKLDDSEDNNKKDDKQTQTSKITHQQAISNEVDALQTIRNTRGPRVWWHNRYNQKGSRRLHYWLSTDGLLRKTTSMGYL